MIELPETVAIFGSLEIYVHAPSDLETGFAITTSGSPANFSRLGSAVYVGVPFTVSVIVTGFEGPNFAEASCKAVIVVFPGAIIRALFPSTVATLGSDDVSVHAPVELEVGTTSEIDGDDVAL